MLDMSKKCRFMYDDFSDRLLISCKKKEDVVSGSVRVHDLILTFDSNKQVIGAEIKNASKYLEQIGLNSNILNSLTGADLVFQQKREGYLIYFILHSGKITERIPYNLITSKPLIV